MVERPRHVSENLPLRTREIGIDDPPTEDVSRCLDVWRSWCDGRRMPAWKNADRLMDLPHAVLPMTLVAEVTGEPLDFIYRYWGSGVTRMHGYDLTGQSCHAVQPETFAEIVYDAMSEVVRRREPILYAGETTTATGLVVPEYVLRLPFSDNGEDVDRVMTVAWLDAPEAAGLFGGGR